MGCNGLTSVNLAGLAGVTHIGHWFMEGCSGLTRLDLSALDQQFRETPKATSSIPDGNYPVRVEHVELATTRSSRRPVLKWTLRPLVR